MILFNFSTHDTNGNVFTVDLIKDNDQFSKVVFSLHYPERKKIKEYFLDTFLMLRGDQVLKRNTKETDYFFSASDFEYNQVAIAKFLTRSKPIKELN